MSAHWSAGYTTDINYTLGYFPQQSPRWIEWALMSARRDLRPGQPLRYLELGYGQGFSLALHAAATPGEYLGTDFNPAHAVKAREFAQASGSPVVVLDDSFEELLQRRDLPAFDVITMHGIWSWVSDANRQVLVDIARRHLAVGGVLYVSYNCLPGWAAPAPLRHLLKMHAERASSVAGGPLNTAREAIDFAQRLADLQAGYFRANPVAGKRLERVRKADQTYVVHEYLNSHWNPMHFAQVADQLREAKLEYVCSTDMVEHIDQFCFAAEQIELLEGIHDPVLNQTVRDYIHNRQFRCDLWVKGARALSPFEHVQRVEEQRFVLAVAPQNVHKTLSSAVGEVKLDVERYMSVVEQLASQGARPKSVGELARAIPSLGLGDVLQVLRALSSVRDVLPAQDEAVIEAARKTTRGFNDHLIKRAELPLEERVNQLASPIAGCGIDVARFDQLFLGARRRGLKTPKEWARVVADILARNGERLVDESGQAIDSREVTLERLLKRAEQFEHDALGVLKTLGVAD